MFRKTLSAILIGSMLATSVGSTAFAGVDPIAVTDIQGIIGYLKKNGVGVLITDHNVRETLKIVDRAYILNEGQVLLSGDSNTIAASEVAKKFFLGKDFSM